MHLANYCKASENIRHVSKYLVILMNNDQENCACTCWIALLLKMLIEFRVHCEVFLFGGKIHIFVIRCFLVVVFLTFDYWSICRRLYQTVLHYVSFGGWKVTDKPNCTTYWYWFICLYLLALTIIHCLLFLQCNICTILLILYNLLTFDKLLWKPLNSFGPTQFTHDYGQ